MKPFLLGVIRDPASMSLHSGDGEDGDNKGWVTWPDVTWRIRSTWTGGSQERSLAQARRERDHVSIQEVSLQSSRQDQKQWSREQREMQIAEGRIAIRAAPKAMAKKQELLRLYHASFTRTWHSNQKDEQVVTVYDNRRHKYYDNIMFLLNSLIACWHLSLVPASIKREPSGRWVAAGITHLDKYSSSWYSRTKLLLLLLGIHINFSTIQNHE